MTHSKRKRVRKKPAKPYKTFPLSPHACGQWCKKIRGKIYYFGVWEDPQAALDFYNLNRDDLHSGRVDSPQTHPDSISLRELCNAFMKIKTEAVEAGRISARSKGDYRNSVKRLLKILGDNRTCSSLIADDFSTVRNELDKTLANRSIANEIGRIRMVFKFGVDQGLIAKLPPFGQSFNKPSKAVIRRDRLQKTKQLFSPTQIKQLIDVAGYPLKAMILLGINSGMGNADVARIEHRHIDFETGWIDYPRWKTAVARRFPMWPETIEALKESIDRRPDGGEEAQIFCTVKGFSWFKETSTNPITQAFKKLLLQAKIEVTGINFYALRHSFETYAGDLSRDQVAVNTIMGHADSSMAEHYREGVADDRLLDVVNAVRDLIFARPKIIAKTRVRLNRRKTKAGRQRSPLTSSLVTATSQARPENHNG